MTHFINFTIKLFLYPLLFLLVLPRVGQVSVFQGLLIAFTLSDLAFAADLMLLHHLDRTPRLAGDTLLVATGLYLFQFFLPGMHLSPLGALFMGMLTTAADTGLRGAFTRTRQTST